MTLATPPFSSLAELTAALRADRPGWLPILATVEEMDRTLRRLGLLAEGDSLAMRLPWQATLAIAGSSPEARDVFIASWLGDARDRLKGLTLADSPVPDGADFVILALGLRTDESEAAAKAVLANSARDRRLLILDGVDTPAPEDGPDRAADDWRQALLPGSDEPILIRRDGSADAEIAQRLDAVNDTARQRLLDRLDALLSPVESEIVPQLTKRLRLWRRLVLLADAVWVALLAAAAFAIVRSVGSEAVAPFIGWLFELRPDRLGGLLPLRAILGAAIPLVLVALGHLWLRAAVRQRLALGLDETAGDAGLRLRDAFLRSAGPFRPLFAREPKGWNGRGRRRFAALRGDLAGHAARQPAQA